MGFRPVGTGSYPPLLHGLHRSILFIDKYEPFMNPKFSRASIAYSEHVGVNLQLKCDWKGIFLYNFIKFIAMFFKGYRHPFLLLYHGIFK